MKKYSFKDITNKDLLLYSYLRGSRAYGIDREDSDYDYGGVFMEPIEAVLGLQLNFPDQIMDEGNNMVWYGLRKYMTLLLTSNPTVLESLFIPDKCVLYTHPYMELIKSHKQEFITKECFKSFIGYAKTQISKASGLNKKINNPIVERKGVLDFVYTFYNQGSTKIKNWLDYRGLDQKYCGLVNIPNMHEIYGVYYDWGTFFKEKGITLSDLKNSYYGNKGAEMEHMVDFLLTHVIDYNKGITDYITALTNWFGNVVPIGYKGIVGEDGESNEVRYSSVAKGEKPICYVSYNKTGYTKHCIDYKNYKDWEEHRNPIRYKENIRNNKGFDAKNMAHSVRLLHMGIEIAKTGEMHVDRRDIDREFILSIRDGKMDYDELMAYLISKEKEMNIAMEESTIPDKIDIDMVNEILLEIRRLQLKNFN